MELEDTTVRAYILIFVPNTSNMPIDNECSLNIPITIKIIALTNKTVIETSVLALYLSIHY